MGHYQVKSQMIKWELPLSLKFKPLMFLKGSHPTYCIERRDFPKILFQYINQKVFCSASPHCRALRWTFPTIFKASPVGEPIFQKSSKFENRHVDLDR
jgi:hypothetical protein